MGYTRILDGEYLGKRFQETLAQISFECDLADERFG